MSTLGNVRSAGMVGRVGLAGVGLVALLVSPALAQQDVQPPAWQAEAAPADPGYPANDEWNNQAAPETSDGAPLIPPNVEGPAYPAANGNYCYVGPHPVDTRVAPGPSWDDTQGQHFRAYAPIDTRLYAFRDGCYYFTGDPRDFGYGGQTYAYYGAHPLLDAYGGGWCFMMGPHNHMWRPWSPLFTVVGSWNYWHGPYDPFFWTYWPYYSFYYRTYYPSYYGGGRFYGGGGYRIAPPIRPVQVQAWRGASTRGAGVYRGTPPTPGMRSNPSAPASVYRGYAAPNSGNGFHQGVGPGYHPGAPTYRSNPPSFQQSAPSYHQSAPSFHQSAPSFSAPSRPSFSPSPGRSFAPSGGGFHGGGGMRRR